MYVCMITQATLKNYDYLLTYLLLHLSNFDSRPTDIIIYFWKESGDLQWVMSLISTRLVQELWLGQWYRGH